MLSRTCILVCVLFLGRSITLQTGFYKAEPGVLLNAWFNQSSTSLNFTNRVNGYPSCPYRIENLANFERNLGSTTRYHHLRLRAYFVPTLTGVHRMIVACKQDCEVGFELQPGNPVTVKHSDTVSSKVGWTNSKLSNGLSLIKGFRYKIDARYVSGPSDPFFIKLGMLLPNGTEIKPLDGRYLRRSMEFYKIDGLLGEKYNKINWTTPLTVQAFEGANTLYYPNSPTRIFCRPSIYDEAYDNFSGTYAVRYTGYFMMPQTGDFQWYMSCDSYCEANVTMANSSVATLYDNTATSPAIKSVGRFMEKKYHPVNILHVDGGGNDFISLKAKQVTDTSWKHNWNGLLTNLLQAETHLFIPSPMLTVESSTAISAQLSVIPTVPAGDKWRSSNSFKLLYYKTRDPSSKIPVALSGSLPIKRTFTGLEKYTEYTFYFQYYGFIQSTIEHNLLSAEKTVRTEEDVPEDYPPGVKATAISSTSILVSLVLFPISSRVNGILVGYTVKYKIQGSSSWLYLLTSTSSLPWLIGSLRKFTVYELHIAARTSKGAGVYSPRVVARTAEDAPTWHPQSLNVLSRNGAAVLTWQPIPSGHRNGIIRRYVVRYRAANTITGWNETEVTGLTVTVKGLIRTQIYEFKVAGATTIGLGPFSRAVETPGFETNSFSLETPKAFVTNMKFRNKALLRHVSKMAAVRSVEDCFQLCRQCSLKGSGCICASINIKITKSASLVCEISRNNMKTFPNDLVSSEGSQYYEVC